MFRNVTTSILSFLVSKLYSTHVNSVLGFKNTFADKAIAKTLSKFKHIASAVNANSKLEELRFSIATDPAEQVKVWNTFTTPRHNRELQEQSEGLRKLSSKPSVVQPKLRFSGFLNDWEITTLGKNCTWIQGKGLHKDKLNTEGKGYQVLHYSVLFYYRGYIPKEALKYYTESDEGVFIPDNSILFLRSSHSGVGLDNVNTIDVSNVKASEAVIIGSLPNNIYSRFMSYQLNGKPKAFLPYVIGQAVKNISTSGLSCIKVGITSIEEQQKIGNFFKEIDKKILNLEKSLFVVQEMKKAVSFRLFLKNSDPAKLRFHGFTDNWRFITYGETLSYEQPTKYLVQSTQYNDKYSIPVLTAGKSFILGYTNEDFGIKEASKDNRVIIFDDFTTSSHLIDFPFKIKSSVIKILSVKDKSKYDISFIFNRLNQRKFVMSTPERQWISVVSQEDFLIPSFAEQQKIGGFLTEVDQLISAYQSYIDLNKKLKQALVQRMFV